MAIAAGVDFGTLSVRVTLLDSSRGRLGTTSKEYPLHRRRDDPDYATQSHADQMAALAAAMQEVLREAGVDGNSVDSVAIDTTGSSVIPVDKNLEPLDEYYLWCDHRAKEEARQITDLAHSEQLEAIQWCGGVYSHEWGFAKLLHWLRHNPEKRERFATALENCDMVTATLCGIRDPRAVLVQWATNGSGIQNGMACHRNPSFQSWTRYSKASATSLKASASRRTSWPGILHPIGRKNSASAPGYRSRSALSMLIGMPWEPVAAKGM